MVERFDVAVIGGGVVGCAIARDLSLKGFSVAVVERESDVARGTSGKNSGVVHTGINVPPGSLKAALNVKGAAMFEDLCRELDVPFKRVGKLVVALDENQIPDLEALASRGAANGVPSLEIVDQATIRRMEPNIRGCAALHAPTAAITCPYSLTIALADAAVDAGANFFLESPVTGIDGDSHDFTLTTPNVKIQSALVVNSAGLHADRVAAMAGIKRYRIYPCRGEYVILDRNKGGLINGMVYPVPPRNGPGLGVHITPTVDGNILLGPSANYVRGRDDARTTRALRQQLIEEASEFLSGFTPRDVITAYAGLRPKLVPSSVGGFGDFIIEEAPERQGLMNLVGIESPGLTAAPAIADLVSNWAGEYLRANGSGQRTQKLHATPRLRELSPDDQAAVIAEDPACGDIICRCEMVSRREVVDAIENPLGAVSLTSIKYRSRAMMGRCQGATCGPRVIDLLLEHGFAPEELTQMGGDSWLFVGSTKGLRRDEKAGSHHASRKAVATS